MKRSMMVNNDIRHDKEKLECFIHHQHHAQFLDVCLELQTVTVPKGLEIMKRSCTRVTDNKFLENWRNILKDVELTLMRELTEKNKCIYSELHSEFFIEIEQATENNIDIAIIRDLKQYFGKIENELFNRRITKFVKVAKDPDI